MTLIAHPPYIRYICIYFIYGLYFRLESELQNRKLGGPGMTVEVDETKVGRRKNHKGRVVDGCWVFGMIERESGELRIEVCQDNRRDAATLTALIHKHVNAGSTIMSDCWRGYTRLEDEGFQHLTVNHSRHFIDPVSGAHTQRIGIRKNEYGLHFSEYLWFQRYSEDPFSSLVSHIAEIY